MPYSLNVEGHEKSQLVISLAALLLADAGLELTSDGLDAVVKASGNSIPAYYSKMYAAYLEKSGGVEKFCSGPSAGGGKLMKLQQLQLYKLGLLVYLLAEVFLDLLLV